VHHHTKFQQNAAMHGCVVEDLTNLRDPFFRKPPKPLGLRRKWAELHKVWKTDTSIIDALTYLLTYLQVGFRFKICCSVSLLL